MRAFALLALVAASSTAFPRRAAAGEPGACDGRAVVAELGTPEDDLLRLAELTGETPVTPRALRRAAPTTTCLELDASPPPPRSEAERGETARVRGAGEPVEPLWPLTPAPEGARWLQPLPVRLTTVFNTRYPRGGNDGLLWAGRGASALVSAGVAFRYGVLSGVLRPEATWSQNAWFRTQDTGATGDLAYQNAYYPGRIDLPQRFGAGPFSKAALGDSVLRLDWHNLALGVSNERMWWGPGLSNALVMSDNAPGFPHVFLGTTRPAYVWVGHVEAIAFWGRVFRTEYFDGGKDPLIIGFAFDYTPRWIPNLTVGLGRSFLQPWEGRRAIDYIPFLQSFWKKDLHAWYGDANDDPQDNQLASVFWRWVFPSAGLELYGEWGREDHDWSMYRFIEDFDWSRAYTLGLQKVFELSGGRFLRFGGEVADLSAFRPSGAERGTGANWYTHGGDLGYTNGGQVIGASIGPGADSQRVVVDVFSRSGRIGGFVERVRRNEGYYYQAIDPLPGEEVGHDAELTAGVRQVLFAGPVDVAWELAASYRWNRDFLGDAPNFRGLVTLSLPVTAGASERRL